MQYINTNPCHCASLLFSQLLAHELALGEGLPPLVLDSLGTVELVHHAHSQFFTSLLEESAE